MSAPVETVREAGAGTLPSFELDCLFDDVDDPTEVTVFVTGSQTVSEWITADVDTAVPLDEIR